MADSFSMRVVGDRRLCSHCIRRSESQQVKRRPTMFEVVQPVIGGEFRESAMPMSRSSMGMPRWT
jgi:hypothetical protein